MMFRRIAQEAEKISASVDECALLADFYGKTEVKYQKEIKSILQKVGCEISTLDTSLLEAQKIAAEKMSEQQKQYRNVSVFGTLGWVLFFIAFSLKLHYLVSYKKHKKIHEKLVNNK